MGRTPGTGVPALQLQTRRTDDEQAPHPAEDIAGLVMHPYYAEGVTSLYQGDCVDVLEALDVQPHLIVADPPYMDKVDEDWDRQWDDPAAFLEWLGDVLDRCAAVLHERGTIAVFCSPEMAGRVEAVVAERFLVLNHIVWRKPTPGRAGAQDKAGMRRFFPLSERIILAENRHGIDGELFAFTQRTNYAVAAEVYEDIRLRLVALRDAAGLSNADVDTLLGTVGMAGHYFGASQWCLPTEQAWNLFAEALEIRGVQSPSWDELRSEFDGKRREFDGKRRDQINPRTLAFDWELFTDVWTFEPVLPGNGRHPCEKPAGLIAHLVNTMSRPGDLVLDPFTGSGVTADVCRRLDRSFVGIELDESWCARIVRRLAQGILAL